MSAPNSLTKATKPRIPSTPIELLNTDTAKLYTHVHPILLLSLYALRFNAIVADPVPALFNTLILLGILQIAYVAICLPPTGSEKAAAAAAPKVGVKKKQVGRLEGGVWGKIIVSGIEN